MLNSVIPLGKTFSVKFHLFVFFLCVTNLSQNSLLVVSTDEVGKKSLQNIS